MESKLRNQANNFRKNEKNRMDQRIAQSRSTDNVVETQIGGYRSLGAFQLTVFAGRNNKDGTNGSGNTVSS